MTCSAGMQGSQFMHQQQPPSIIQPTGHIRGEFSGKFLVVILMAECLSLCSATRKEFDDGNAHNCATTI